MGILRAIGTMSGTSLDGIDVALVETDGERIAGLGPAMVQPYSESERDLLRAALAAARTLDMRHARPGILAQAEAMITQRHAQAVGAFIARHAIGPVDVVGFHGQTVLHRPDRRLTVQIGDGPALARALGVPVVYDLRAADVAAGGQGAPLVPVYHRALAREMGVSPVAVVNIGGVANITYIAGDTLLACDTGPGNALLDDFMLRMTGVAMDRDGAMAMQGQPDEAWLAQAMAHPFFAAALPKSLDRDDFSALAMPSMSIVDGAATLTAFTARSIAAIGAHLPARPQHWIIVGGGARNPALMAMLTGLLAPAQVLPAQDLGWNGDAIEAQAFGFLAVRALKGLPLTYPGTTGVTAPLAGGVLVRP